MIKFDFLRLDQTLASEDSRLKATWQTYIGGMGARWNLGIDEHEGSLDLGIDEHGKSGFDTPRGWLDAHRRGGRTVLRLAAVLGFANVNQGSGLDTPRGWLDAHRKISVFANVTA